MTNNYTGYVTLNDEQIAQFYEHRALNTDVMENGYVLIGNDAYCHQNGDYRRVEYPTIESIYSGTIKPLDVYQRITMDMLKDKQSKIKLVRGQYGSGKTFLVFNWALQEVDNGNYDKIVFVRPNVSLKDVPDIGFLPGEVDDKLGWTLAPIIDHIGGQEGLKMLTAKNIIESVPLLWIRGRSFSNSIILVEESQNITTEIAKILISRIGEGSILVLDGDYHQTDSRIYDKDNGLAKMVERLSGNKLFATTYLPITHRSDAAELASLLDD